MDVILLEDLKGVGSKGVVVNVKPGYARNYLLPRRLAIAAGSRSANLFQELERQRQVRDDKQLALARAEAERLNGTEINIPAPANEEDTLFGSIGTADIAAALRPRGARPGLPGRPRRGRRPRTRTRCWSGSGTRRSPAATSRGASTRCPSSSAPTTPRRRAASSCSTAWWRRRCGCRWP